jgi:hypothetical protein
MVGPPGHGKQCFIQPTGTWSYTADFENEAAEVVLDHLAAPALQSRIEGNRFGKEASPHQIPHTFGRDAQQLRDLAAVHVDRDGPVRLLLLLLGHFAHPLCGYQGVRQRTGEGEGAHDVSRLRQWAPVLTHGPRVCDGLAGAFCAPKAVKRRWGRKVWRDLAGLD